MPILIAWALFGCSEQTASSTVSQETEKATLETADSSIVKLDNGMYSVEGDMLLTEEQLAARNISALTKTTQGALFGGSGVTAWPAGSVIEYYLVPASSNQSLTNLDVFAQHELVRALRDISNGVNIQFKQVASPGAKTIRVYAYTDDEAFREACGISPEKPTGAGCATLGMQSNNNGLANFNGTTQLGFTYETFFHEFCHILGFQHEHDRADRDSYVNSTETIVTDGSYLNTSFDMASIMLYPVTAKSNPELAVWKWLGGLPLQSPDDVAARKTKYGATTAEKNMFLIRHRTTGKYLCRSKETFGATPVLSATANSLCSWDVTTGSVNLQQISATSGIRSVWDAATTIRSPYIVNHFLYYFEYLPTTQTFSMGTEGSLQYASKWVPISHQNGSLILWNPAAGCLMTNNEGTALAVASGCNEATIRDYVITIANVQWDLYPQWSTTSAF